MTWRRLLGVAYAGYLLVVAWLVWNPDPAAPGGAVDAVVAAFAWVGLPVGAPVVEFALNVVMFVPLSLLGAFLFGRWRLHDWFLIGLAATVLIEMVQGLLMSTTRTSSSLDVVANTGGSVLGYLGAVVLREVAHRRRADRMSA